VPDHARGAIVTAVGRLEDIIDRNKNPRKHRQMRFPIGLMLSAFVLLILVLFIFTDLAQPPDTKDTQAPSLAPGEKHVDGVRLYRERKVKPDAGAAGSAATP
jgi:type VI protein secretion system component VasF